MIRTHLKPNRSIIAKIRAKLASRITETPVTVVIQAQKLTSYCCAARSPRSTPVTPPVCVYK